MSVHRQYRCPACGEKTGVYILYGYPTLEMFEASERGEIVLGGCCVCESDPDRQCLSCDHTWKIQRRKHDPSVLKAIQPNSRP
jgi:hypothetical protein